MTEKNKGGGPYRISRRTTHKTTGKELSGYALDLTIRANAQGAYFLQDHNSARNTMPLTDRDDLAQILLQEVARNHKEHFGSS